MRKDLVFTPAITSARLANRAGQVNRLHPGVLPRQDFGRTARTSMIEPALAGQLMMDTR